MGAYSRGYKLHFFIITEISTKIHFSVDEINLVWYNTNRFVRREFMDEKILKALGEPKRFLLLQLMAERGYCVRALARLSYLSESAVSQHLKILREAGLVYGVKKGYYTHYCLDKKALGNYIDELLRIRDAKSQPCNRPFYGCPEAEHIRCRSYVPPEQRRKEDEPNA